jgi:hypothetical protein
MGIDQITKRARRMHTHLVVFKAGSDEDFVARYGMLGLCTRAIAAKTGLSEGQVQYRLAKGGVKRAGKDGYRNGTNQFAKKVLAVGVRMARAEVANKIAPKFAGVSVTGINQ